MSVIVDFSIFPIGQGQSVAAHAAKAVAVIRASGLSHFVGPMGTSVEGEWDEVMAVVARCHEVLRADCDRVYLNLRIDSRAGAPGRLASKLRAVEPC